MTPRALGRLGLLGALYLSQGLPFGFFTQALPALLRELGLSLPAIGLTSLLALPWALKFLWAPLVDRWGHRRTWILVTQGLSAGLSVLVALLSPSTQLPLVLLCVLLSNLLAATQDIATDGLAVDLLPPGERGLANGVQVAGYRLGMILGGGLLLVWFAVLGWAGVFGLMAALLLVASLPVALSRQLPRPPPSRVTPGEASFWLRDAVDWLRLPGHGRWLVGLLLFKAGHHLAEGMLRPWLVDAGMGLDEIGWLLGGGGFTAGLLGALVGGASVNGLGRRATLGAWGVLGSLGAAGYGAVVANGTLGAWLWMACLAEHFASGMATAALFTAMMDTCRPGHGGGDYTLQASAVVLASGVAAGVSGFGASALGYGGLFALAAVLGCLGAAAAAASYPGLSATSGEARGAAPG